MTFKPGIWRRIAAALSVLNVAGAGYALAMAEPWHATIHVALALAFGLWALRPQPAPGGSELEDRLDALEVEAGKLRQELSDAQERIDFAERLLAQRPDPGRVGDRR